MAEGISGRASVAALVVVVIVSAVYIWQAFAHTHNITKASQPSPTRKVHKRTKSKRVQTLFDMEFYESNSHGAEKPLGNLGYGDTVLLFDVLPCTKDWMGQLKKLIMWHTMGHKGGEVPRLVSIQGTLQRDSDIEPIYRHPANASPELVQWSPLVEDIKDRVTRTIFERTGQCCHFNHALIQFYRDGSDYISEHTDKTLDIAIGSTIANVSFGASREMILRQKMKGKIDKDRESQEREIQRVMLPDRSVLVMSWNTNREWTHEIKRDRRSVNAKRPDELSYEGQRISITFRSIATYRRRKDNLLFGQGAFYKTEAELDAAIALDGIEAVVERCKDSKEQRRSLLHAFSVENNNPQFDWNYCYGSGFSVVSFDKLS